MDILGKVRKVPSGLMIVPMIITAIINTFAPKVLRIGGVTEGLFTNKGTMAVIGIILFITGTQFRLNEIGNTLRRGGIVSLGRLIIGYMAAILVLKLWGLDGFLGLSALALGVGIVSTNPGIYISIIEQHGDNIDRAAFGVLNIIAVPAAPILIMEAAGGAGIDYLGVVSTLAPFVIGMILGSLDEKIRGMMGPAMPVMLPFLGFCFGSSINLIKAAQAGGAGILLAVLYLVINIPLMFLLDRTVLCRPGYMAVATCAVAGISVVVPGMLAATNPVYGPYVEAATAQLALAVVITNLVTPWVVSRIVKRFGSGKVPAEAAAQAAPQKS